MQLEVQRTTHALPVDQVDLRVAAIHRDGPLAPILFLHGFGSTKEDYADIARHPAFDGRPFLAYDAPGCGETDCADLARISIPFLVHTAIAMLDRAGYEQFHLVGHSMCRSSLKAETRRHLNQRLSGIWFIHFGRNGSLNMAFFPRKFIELGC